MSAVVLSFVGPPKRQTVQASVTCDHCTWGATQTGRNAIEVSLWLRALILRHFMERHPEVPPKDLP